MEGIDLTVAMSIGEACFSGQYLYRFVCSLLFVRVLVVVVRVSVCSNPFGFAFRVSLLFLFAC